MNYATDWTALPLERKNALCAEAMGWRRSRPHATPPSQAVWCDEDGRGGKRVDDWSPCTDRNHTAMMVEAVVAQGSTTTFIVAFASSPHWPDPTEDRSDLRVIVALTASPDLLAWAACEALRQSVAAKGAADATSGQGLPKEEA